MSKKTPVPGVDYWPDAADWKEMPPQPSALSSLVVRALLFLLVFSALQVMWLMIRDNSFGHFIRGDLTVSVAAALINVITPSIHATALGNQILAPGGGLVVKPGCDGIEVLFILTAALLIVPLSSCQKLKGIVFGTLFIYGCNQLRILSLFYAFRADKQLFHLLHGTLAPLILIALAGLFFHFWLLKHPAHQ